MGEKEFQPQQHGQWSTGRVAASKLGHDGKRASERRSGDTGEPDLDASKVTRLSKPGRLGSQGLPHETLMNPPGDNSQWGSRV